MAKQDIKIHEYQFGTFANPSLQDLNNKKKTRIEEFTFKEFSEIDLTNKKIPEKVIKRESDMAKNNAFSILPIVEKHRGIEEQKRIEFDRQVEEEVQKRVQEIQEEAFQSGYEEGKRLGIEESLKNEKEESIERMEQLELIIHTTLDLKNEIFSNQKWEFLEIIKNLTKWVILRELKTDPDYLLRLLEKLILELQVKNNLLIKVNKDNFQEMPHILELLQERLGNLTNVRVEVEQATNFQGIIIESEKGILDGRFETQMKNLDNLFLMIKPESE